MTNTVDKFNEQDKHIDSYTWKHKNGYKDVQSNLRFGQAFFQNRWFSNRWFPPNALSAGSKPSQRICFWPTSKSPKQETAERMAAPSNTPVSWDQFIRFLCEVANNYFEHLEILWNTCFCGTPWEIGHHVTSALASKNGSWSGNQTCSGRLNHRLSELTPKLSPKRSRFRLARWWQGMPWYQRNTPAVQSTNGFWTKQIK